MVVRRLYDYSTTIRREKLRLLQKLLRLFQPERCDYCSPLLAIGRKPEKRCGGKPPMVPRRPLCSCRWTVPPGGVCALTADRCQIVSRRAGTVCDVLHRLIWIYNRYAPLHPYIPYYNRWLRSPVQRPAWRLYLVCAGGAALGGMPSSVAQVVYRQLVRLLCCA